MMASDESLEVLRQRARRVVYERLAAITALIWVLGTLVLVLTTVPVIERPVRQFATAMTIPIIPAALPWLLYGYLSNRLARRWANRAV
jgi:membrane protein DedA with SNARE-associated domain